MLSFLHHSSHQYASNITSRHFQNYMHIHFQISLYYIVLSIMKYIQIYPYLYVSRCYYLVRNLLVLCLFLWYIYIMDSIICAYFFKIQRLTLEFSENLLCTGNDQQLNRAIHNFFQYSYYLIALFYDSVSKIITPFS